MKGGNRDETVTPHRAVSFWLPHSKSATLMNPLTPHCVTTWQSPHPDLTSSSLIYLSPTDKTDSVDVSLSNHPIKANWSQKREERIEKKVLGKEMDID